MSVNGFELFIWKYLKVFWIKISSDKPTSFFECFLIILTPQVFVFSRQCPSFQKWRQPTFIFINIFPNWFLLTICHQCTRKESQINSYFFLLHLAVLFHIKKLIETVAWLNFKFQYLNDCLILYTEHFKIHFCSFPLTSKAISCLCISLVVFNGEILSWHSFGITLNPMSHYC